MPTCVRFVLLSCLSFLVPAAALAQAGGPTGEQRWRALTDGSYAYRLYCAQCHGTTGAGDGPNALELSTAVPDLRTIEFDRGRVVEHIYATGQWDREPMPPWGNVLRAGAQRSDGYAFLAAHNLMLYVETLQPLAPEPRAPASQAKQPTPGPSIVQVPVRPVRIQDPGVAYQAYCSSCHGAAGRGDGPAAAALPQRPPDLTLISVRDGRYDRRHVYAHIADPTMHAGMPDWQNALSSIYSDHSTQLALHNLERHIEVIQVVK